MVANAQLLQGAEQWCALSAVFLYALRSTVLTCPSRNNTAYAVSRKVVKGEDKSLLAPGLRVGDVPLSLFAVFDGHGGKQTAELLVRCFWSALEEELVRDSSTASP